MSKALKSTFLVHAVIAALGGLVLLIVPGGFLGWLNWRPIDPILSRLFGAALLALAWSSFQGWRAREWMQVAVLVQLEVVFTVLACVGLLRHLLFSRYPLMVWLLFVVFFAFAIAWSVFLVRHRE